MSFSSVNFIVNRNSIIFLFLGLLTSMLFVLDLLSGDSALSVGQVWNAFMGNETNMTTRNIVLSIRLVRVIVAVLIGVALSISGLQMQTVFRNPLADPYLLGVSSLFWELPCWDWHIPVSGCRLVLSGLDGAGPS